MERLSKAMLDEGKFEEAQPYFEKLLKLYPHRFELKVDLAKCLSGRKKLEEARELLEEVLETNPNHIEANFDLGRIEAMMGDRTKAVERFESLVESTQDHAQRFFKTELALLYSDEGRYQEAIELLKENLEATPDDAREGLRLFYTYRQAGEDESALQLAEDLIEGHPDELYVKLAYSQALAANDRTDEATDRLLKEIEKGEEPELLYGAIAQLFVSRSEYSEAQGWIEKGLEQFPDSTRLRFQFGAVLERQKDYEDAEIEFKKILSTNPDDAEVLNYLGYMLADLGVRLDEALGYIQKAVDLDPYNGAFLDSLGWVYFKQNRLEEAEENLIKAARINDSDPVIYEHLGDLYVQLGTLDKARYFYEKSMAHAENEEESERVKEKLTQLKSSIDG
jgi:tetratricopeptide (TPR) repeat protein